MLVSLLDNDDFELEGVALTYVYFREASAEEAAQFEAAQAAVEIATKSAEEARNARRAALATLAKFARGVENIGSDAKPDLTGARVLHEMIAESIWNAGEILAATSDEIIFIKSRPRGGDWMDCQKLHEVYRRELAEADDAVKNALASLSENAEGEVESF